MQTNGAIKWVLRAVGFQMTLPTDYTLIYVLRKHTQPVCGFFMSSLLDRDIVLNVYKYIF